MYKVKILIITFLAFFLILLQLEGEETIGCFRWALVELEDKEVLTPITDTGDNGWNEHMRIFFQPIKAAYLYVLLTGSGDKLKILFPGSFREYDHSYETFKKFIPGDDNSWFFEEPGEEKEIHFLVASERLRDLETLIDRYLKSKFTLTNKRLEIKKKILIEIQWLKSNYLLMSNNKEKQVQSTGVFRGYKNQIDLKIKEVEFTNLYAKKFSF